MVWRFRMVGRWNRVQMTVRNIHKSREGHERGKERRKNEIFKKY